MVVLASYPKIQTYIVQHILRRGYMYRCFNRQLHTCIRNSKNSQINYNKPQNIYLPPRFYTTTNVVLEHDKEKYVQEEEQIDDTQKINKTIGIWLFAVAGQIFGMVVLGGQTRLTRSGQSMVHWKFTGEKRPTTLEEWEKEFSRYKETPEYKLHNQNMTLDEFKFIYQMEYAHRTLGRIIGVFFATGYVYFCLYKRKQVTKSMKKQLSLLLGLGAIQGFIGWWMVKSGLDPEENKVQARVSPYRLATHLIYAFGLYTIVLITGYRAFYGAKGVVNKSLEIPKLKKIKMLTHISAGQIFQTIFSGAFVAGTKAGLIYNEFPYFGGKIIPSDIIDPYIKPSWKNIFENPTMVQFTHRYLAITTTIMVLTLYIISKRSVNNIPKKIRSSITLLTLATIIQVSLGITTLLTNVEIDFAAAHQANSLALLTYAIRTMYITKSPTNFRPSNVLSTVPLIAILTALFSSRYFNVGKVNSLDYDTLYTEST